ncbi:MAG TPA: alpha/beta fold hydrolase [Actinocrinis sp.]|uniref:alpha/beta fold hydrolase n=1 Tax=Actinocrinis sp. TaxID=1920516 RepID=UPI002DDCB69E|nr:alpha/beta fold hydrolase [Actinocrinis sp.]HEV2347941.1 alpha/beta fold hydrolase [Actinocrinis sp.]
MLGVVFVHGFNSNPRMWDAFGRLVAGDRALSRAVAEALPRFGYATALRRWHLARAIPSLDTAADSLKEYLRTEASPERFERLVLVGHSMGGLVIQRCLVRMLAEGRGQELTRVRRVVLLATPNAGSLLAAGTRRVLLGSNPQEQQLRPLNAQVADTLRIVLRDVVGAAVEPTERTCHIEFSVYAGESDAVVPPASAQAGFPDPLALPGDHFTIVRPDSHEHRTYTTIRRLLLEATGSDPPPQSVITLDPAVLEVHNAVAAGQNANASLTTYLPRAHDHYLRELLIPTFAGGGSRLVTLSGGSATGKTRAIYQALVELAPHAPMLRPADARALLDLLETGQVKPGYVLWLNEAQRYLYDAVGEQAAARLRTTLESTAGIATLATLWNDPFWRELTIPEPGDPHAQARALLTHPGFAVRLDVPDHLTAKDLEAWRQLVITDDDPRLKEALAAGAGDGRVIQHLSGGPELLRAYLAGPGMLFTAREYALLNAALDARRLGHMSPLPATLLAQAADDDLPARHRASDRDWAQRDLHSLASGRRADGSRTDIRNTLTALSEVRTRAGTEPGYEPADYLDQYSRRRRADQIGTPALWRSLIEHTVDLDDQDRLARAAWDRGLRTTSVSLWHKAVTAGSPTAGLAQLGPDLDPSHAAATYSATHAELANPSAVVSLLQALREIGAEQAVATLLGRNPAACVDPTDPSAVAWLLKELRETGEEVAVATLATRAVVHADLTNPRAAARLLEELRKTGKEVAVATLATRAAANADLADQVAVARLLKGLREVGVSAALKSTIETMIAST